MIPPSSNSCTILSCASVGNGPVTGMCTYSLGVVPPAGTGYVYPSQLIPVTAGTFSGCGQIADSGGKFCR